MNIDSGLTNVQYCIDSSQGRGRWRTMDVCREIQVTSRTRIEEYTRFEIYYTQTSHCIWLW